MLLIFLHVCLRLSSLFSVYKMKPIEGVLPGLEVWSPKCLDPDHFGACEVLLRDYPVAVGFLCVPPEGFFRFRGTRTFARDDQAAQVSSIVLPSRTVCKQVKKMTLLTRQGDNPCLESRVLARFSTRSLTRRDG